MFYDNFNHHLVLKITLAKNLDTYFLRRRVLLKCRSERERERGAREGERDRESEREIEREREREREKDRERERE